VNSQHRVALVIGAKGWRGSGTSFAKIAQGLTARGHLVQVVVENERLARAFAAEGITATTVEMPGTSLAVLRRFRRALSPVPDVVLVDGPRERGWPRSRRSAGGRGWCSATTSSSVACSATW